MESGIDTKKRRFTVFSGRKNKHSDDLRADPAYAARWRASSDRMSGLTYRILAVNIIAIMILGGGVLYLGQHTDSLIERELEKLRSQTRFLSGAVSEGAVRPVIFQMPAVQRKDLHETKAIKPELARRMVRRLGSEIGTRIRLFSVDSSILADSHQLAGPGGIVQIENLGPEPEKLNFDSLFAQSATRFLNLIPVQTKLPIYPDTSNSFLLSDVQEALLGNMNATAWMTKEGKIILTAAAPVQNIKQVLGVTLLIEDGGQLEKDIAEVRVDVFRVFLGSLGITVMLSIYLSGLISRPLQKLAIAAEAVRQGKNRQVEIPDMSSRQDEIGELSVVLRDMTQALWDRMDSIERFAADVAHEIKNPLTSLRSAVETASRVKDPEAQKKLMDIIHHDVQRLDRLISDISSASRLDAELSREEMGEVDLEKLLHKLRDAYKQPLKRVQQNHDREDSSIELNIAPGNVVVRGNEDRLEQVFGNLISNALSFSPSDGVVYVHINPKSDRVVITIEDQGPGIPEAKLESVFDRFYTERPGHEDYGSHSGLGLSISKQIVLAHGGKIWAENIMNDDQVTGARFHVVLAAA